jgi:hypothetical protein
LLFNPTTRSSSPAPQLRAMPSRYAIPGFAESSLALRGRSFGRSEATLSRVGDTSGPARFAFLLRSRSCHYIPVVALAGILTLSQNAEIAALRLSGDTLRSVFLFAPSAPAVQIFIATMRAFDRSQLIIERRHCFAVRCGGESDDESARPVLTQPSHIDFAGHHLLRRRDVDVAQWG